MKPVHLSDARGVLIFAQREVQKGFTPGKLAEHMEKVMTERAAESESVALRTLTPGIIIQPRYVSSVGFRAPLELRVTTVWGKARVGTWWWGRNPNSKDEAPHRNVWIVRRLRHPETFSSSDTWEVLHQHPGGNPGFDEAVRLFERHVRAAAAISEAIARAAGAPFLRADFFVGSPTWGVRLNEVAYGSGLDYRTRASPAPDQPSGALTPGGQLRARATPASLMRDDSPAMAYILQEGILLCSRRPAAHFLSRLGAQGDTYAELSVARYPLPTDHVNVALAVALREALAAALTAWAERNTGDEPRKVPPEQCNTPRASSSTAVVQSSGPVVASGSTSPNAQLCLAPGCAAVLGSPIVGATWNLGSPRHSHESSKKDLEWRMGRLSDLQSGPATVSRYAGREGRSQSQHRRSASFVEAQLTAKNTVVSVVSSHVGSSATAAQGLSSGTPLSFGEPRSGRFFMTPPGSSGPTRRAQPGAARTPNSMSTPISSAWIAGPPVASGAKSDTRVGPPMLRSSAPAQGADSLKDLRASPALRAYPAATLSSVGAAVTPKVACGSALSATSLLAGGSPMMGAVA